jgi:hypothetical protein
MNQDRLDAAHRRQHAHTSVKQDKPRRFNIGQLLRAYLVGLRARALPSR